MAKPDIDLAFAIRTYYASDAAATRALFDRLGMLGAPGALAVNLLRASKTSERAKKYRGGDRGGSFRRQSYSTKEWAITNICKLLHAGAIPGIRWGWGIDTALRDRCDPHHHVIYIEISTGQVSFHTGARGSGQDYPGAWDGVTGKGPDRILRFVGRLLAHPATAMVARTTGAKLTRIVAGESDREGGVPPDLFMAG